MSAKSSVANWEAWPEAKKEWCCRREDLGCGFQCSESPDAAGRESDQPERVGAGNERKRKKATLMMNTSLTLGCHGPLKNDHFFLEAASLCRSLELRLGHRQRHGGVACSRAKGVRIRPHRQLELQLIGQNLGRGVFFRDGVRLPMSHFALMSPPFCPPPPDP